MTDPVAPDALREAAIAIVASFYGPQTAIELTDAILAEVAKHRDAEVERLRALIRDLTDPDECWFDHHGGCQAHGYLALQPGEMCPQKEAQILTGVDQ